MKPTPCELLDWDSAFFGKKIARITTNRLTVTDLVSIFDWCARQQIQCLYFLCDLDHDESILLAEEHGFHLVDIKVDLLRQISDKEDLARPSTSPYFVRKCLPSDEAELVSIAVTSASLS